MTGTAFFIYTPDNEQKKEYIISKLEEAFSLYGMKTYKLNLTKPDAAQELQQINQKLVHLPDSSKRFLFSIDGDGFEIKKLLANSFMDDITYNVFSYLTKHPRFFFHKISMANSWYIALLSGTKEGVNYVEQTFPHLDGTDMLVFPYLLGKNSELAISERKHDLLFIADATKENQIFAEKSDALGIKAVIYGNGWENNLSAYRHINILSEQEKTYEKKLDLMGNSKITFFSHDCTDFGADMEIISAAANGSLVFTEKTEELHNIFSSEGIIFYPENKQETTLPKIMTLLQEPDELQKISDAGKEKSIKSSDMTCFINELLKRCK